jgi:hypothetical protein
MRLLPNMTRAAKSLRQRANGIMCRERTARRDGRDDVDQHAIGALRNEVTLPDLPIAALVSLLSAMFERVAWFQNKR